MPQIFKYGKYRVYFWVNENDPLEPVHVHVIEGQDDVFCAITPPAFPPMISGKL